MKLIYHHELPEWPKHFTERTIHFVRVAAGGLTACDFAASTIGRMNQESEVWPLSKQVNRFGETGTFWPRLPLTIVPQLIWDSRPSHQDMKEFLRRCFADVAEANREYVRLTVMLVDLNSYGGCYDYKKARSIAEEVLATEATINELYSSPELA